MIRSLRGMNDTLDIEDSARFSYFIQTAFEFVSTEIGAQSAIAGGGRYDRLVEFLEGRPTPAIGFAIGIERLMELIVMPETTREGYYFGAMDDKCWYIKGIGNKL